MGFSQRIMNRAVGELAMRGFRKEVRAGAPLPGIPGTGCCRNPAAMLIQDRPGEGKWQGFFNSKTGRIYAQLMEQEGLPPSDIYVTSALKSEMPHDRSVEYEIAVWRWYLEREIEIVRPYCLLVVGKLARRVIQDVKGMRRHGRTVYTT